jgi:hypothetical protein
MTPCMGTQARAKNMGQPDSRTAAAVQGAAHQVEGALLGDARLPVPRAQTGRGVGRRDKLGAQGHVQVLRAPAQPHDMCIVCSTSTFSTLFIG